MSPVGPETQRRAIFALEGEMLQVAARVRRNVARTAHAVDPGLGAVGYAVLDVLARQGELRQSALVDIVLIDKGALSRAVCDLTERGLVTTSVDPEDRRGRLVRLTPLGHTRMDALRVIRRGVFEAVLNDWSVEELDQLATSLARYNAAWED